MGGSSSMMSIVVLLLLFVVMYFLMIRPQKKREKETNAMRAALRVGDQIVTIGGICGKIVKTKDETIVIQVGADKVKFEMMRWSVSKVLSEGTGSSKSDSKDDAVEEETTAKKAKPKKLKKGAVEAAPAETPEVAEAPEAPEAPVAAEAPEAPAEAE